MKPRTRYDRVDQIMDRIREEIASRKGVESQHPPTDPARTRPSRSQPFPPILPEPVRLPRRPTISPAALVEASEFHVNDFLGFADAEFLTQAFHGVLRRPPRPDESAQYLDAFRTTKLTHLEALGRLRYSEEGKSQGVRIAGLWSRFQLHRFYRNFPVLSYTVKWFQCVLRLPSKLDALRADDSRLRNRLIQLDELSRVAETTLNAVIPEIDRRFHHLENLLHAIDDRFNATEFHLDSLESEKADFDSVDFLYTQILEVHDFSQRLARLHSQVADLENKGLKAQAYDEIRSEITALQQALADHGLDHRQPIEEIRARTAELEATVASQDLDNLKQRLEETSSLVAGLKENLSTHDLEQLQQRVVQSEAQLAHGQSLVQEIQQQLQNLTFETHDHKRNIVDQQRRLALLLEEARKRLPKPIATDQIESMARERDHLLDAQYVAFEDRFRGTREDIKRRQEVYLPYVGSIKTEFKKYPVIDLGCGRGEWLELLAKTGIRARGVDINKVMVRQCLDLELDVEESDCVEFLKQQKKESLGALTAFHVVEHIGHDILITLLDEALRVLRPGGILILETPNPANLLVASCNFYIDPTHRNPIHSATLRFLIEARGFCNPEILELHPFDKSYRLVGSPLAERISDLLYGPQDYAVIGYKV